METGIEAARIARPPALAGVPQRRHRAGEPQVGFAQRGELARAPQHAHAALVVLLVAANHEREPDLPGQPCGARRAHRSGCTEAYRSQPRARGRAWRLFTVLESASGGFDDRDAAAPRLGGERRRLLVAGRKPLAQGIRQPDHQRCDTVEGGRGIARFVDADARGDGGRPLLQRRRRPAPCSAGGGRARAVPDDENGRGARRSRILVGASIGHLRHGMARLRIDRAPPACRNGCSPVACLGKTGTRRDVSSQRPLARARRGAGGCSGPRCGRRPRTSAATRRPSRAAARARARHGSCCSA